MASISSMWRKAVGTARNYTRDSLSADIVAGLTVAVVALPQSMAYALIAGVPAVYGLYTAIVAGIIGAAFGSSRHLNSGPTNATSLMFASTMAAIPAIYTNRLPPAEMVFLLTLMVGAFKLAFGLLRLGSLVNYISNSVIVGFTAGAGILIAGNQIKNFLGVEVPAGLSFFDTVRDTFRVADTANPYTVVIAAGTLVAVLVTWRINRRLPAPLIAVIGAAVAVFALDLEGKAVKTIGDIPRSLPPFHMVKVDIEVARAMVSGAIAMAIVGLMEATSISKAIAGRSGQRLNSNREFTAQGLANIIGAFFTNFASSGSPTRSVVAYGSGGKTRIAGVLSGVFVAIVVLVFGPMARYIPIAALAGLLMVIAVRMVSREQMLLAWRAGRGSAAVMLTTLVATLTLRLDYAIYLGVVLSLLLFIRRSSAMHITRLVPLAEGRYNEVPIEGTDETEIAGQSVIINVAGEMFFGAMEGFRRQINAVIDLGPRAIVLRLKRVDHVSSTAIATLDRLRERLEERGITFVICGVSEELLGTLRSSGFLDRFGGHRVIKAESCIFDSTQAALKVADVLSGTAEHAGHGTADSHGT